MITLHCSCSYCGHSWNRTIYPSSSVTKLPCAICKDRNVRVKELSDVKIDYYEGAPPFPSKNKKEDDHEYDTYI